MTIREDYRSCNPGSFFKVRGERDPFAERYNQFIPKEKHIASRKAASSICEGCKHRGDSVHVKKECEDFEPKEKQMKCEDCGHCKTAAYGVLQEKGKRFCNEKSEMGLSVYVDRCREACEEFSTPLPRCVHCGSTRQTYQQNEATSRFYLICPDCLARGSQEGSKESALNGYASHQKENSE